MDSIPKLVQNLYPFQDREYLFSIIAVKMREIEASIRPTNAYVGLTMNSQKSSIFKVSGLLFFLAILANCSAPDEGDNDSVSADTAYNMNLDVAQVMTLVLEPASDILWDSGGWIIDASGYEELYPTTDEGWAYVRAQAAIVVESGNMLALPGRAVDSDAWMIYSKGLSDAGILAMESAATQNKEDFFQAGAQIYSVCTACHQAYNPDILNAFDEEAD